MSEVGKLVRSGFWLYLSSIANTLSGFIYWLLISRLAGPRVLGLTTATIGLAALVTGVTSFGITIALQRFVGECRGKGDPGCESEYFWGAFLVSTAAYAGTGLALILAGLAGSGFSSYSPLMLEAAGILVMLGLWGVVYSYVVATLETKLVFMAALIGNTVKITAGILLVYLGFGWIGVTAGYASSWAVMLALLSPRTIGRNLPLTIPGLDRVRNLFKAGLSNWAPTVLTILGQWLAVIAVFGYSGAVQTGYYYVANTIAGFVLGISTMIMGVMVPVLSGMSDGRKRLAWNALRISLAVIAPISGYLVFYPESILGLLGHTYTRASLVLSVLSLGYIPVLLTAGVFNLVYAYGMYRESLLIGLYQNVPRVILYLILTPMLQGLGTALSMAIGGVTGLAYALIVSRRIGFHVNGKQSLEAILVPLAALGPLRLLGVPWPMAAFVAVMVYAYYTRRSILTRSDLRQLSTSLVGEEAVNKAYSRFKWLIDLLVSS